MTSLDWFMFVLSCVYLLYAVWLAPRRKGSFSRPVLAGFAGVPACLAVVQGLRLVAGWSVHPWGGPAWIGVVLVANLSASALIFIGMWARLARPR